MSEKESPERENGLQERLTCQEFVCVCGGGTQLLSLSNSLQPRGCSVPGFPMFRKRQIYLLTVLVAPNATWDLSSQTSNQTYAPFSGNSQS